MNEIEKLRILLPHWIEHNAEHLAEFERWAGCAGPGCEYLREAAHYMEAANQALRAALEKLNETAGDVPHGHQ